MPPLTKEVHKVLRPFIFHGINIDAKEGASQAYGDCPFCGHEEKFSVNLQTGLWDCKRCSASGNPLTFLRQFWEACDQRTQDNSSLASERGLLFPETLEWWGVVKNFLNDKWLIPGHNGEGEIHQLYKRCQVNNKGKVVWTQLLTPSIHGDGKAHAMHGLLLLDPAKTVTYIAEGCWDGMALWEVLRRTKREGDILIPTSDPEQSLLTSCNVVAVPGANVFQEGWCEMFSKQRVILLFDNDHPRPHPQGGSTSKPVGAEGMRRVTRMLTECSKPPKEVQCVWWGDEGFTKDLPDGFDVRDLLNA